MVTREISTSYRLLDHRGQPIQRKVLTTEVAAATVTGIRSPMTGYPGNGLNPTRLANILREADQGDPIRFLELAETIEERDPHLIGVLGTRKRSISQLEITVEDGGPEAAHKEQAEMVRAWLKRDELSGELQDILDAIHKGYSFTEIIWDTSTGQWRPSRLEWRDPRWFDFDRRNLTTPQLIGEGGERLPLPGGKFIYATMLAKSGIPTRGGLARVLAWAWMFKAFSNRDWAIFTQTYGQPIRVGKYGPGASQDEKATLFRAVANIAGDCAAIIPASMAIEFEQAGSVSASSDLYKDRLNFFDQQVSKAVLGQTATTDAIAGGHAVGQEHRQVQEDIERADAKALSAILNRELVKVWIDLQYGPQDVYPRLRIGRPEQKDVKLIVESVRSLRLPVKRSEMYSLVGVSEPEEGDEVLVFGDAAPAKPEEAELPPGGDRREGEARREALQAEGDADPGETGAATQDRAVDELAADAAARAAGATDSMLELIAAIVANATDLEDVRSRLLALAPSLSAKSLAHALRQAIVVAEFSGRADLIDG